MMMMMMTPPLLGNLRGSTARRQFGVMKQSWYYGSRFCLATFLMVGTFCYQLLLQPQWYTLSMTMIPNTDPDLPPQRLMMIPLAAVEPLLPQVATADTMSQGGHDVDKDTTLIETEHALLDLMEAATRNDAGKVASAKLAGDDGDKATMPFNFNTTQGMAACLLIKDDNHWVIEWLAYHWFVLPLRHLVVVIDPDSKTSPRKILDRWKGLMQIDIWEESHFQQPIPESMGNIYQNNTQLMHHRHRQTSFYMKCLQYFQDSAMPWVLLTDTDEFISLDYRGLQKHPQKILRDMAQQFPIQKPGSVLQSLLYHRQMTGKVQKCIYLQRYQVGSREANASLVGRFLPNVNNSNSSDSNSSNMLLQPQDFVTQRFLYETEDKTKIGKNMMHVMAVSMVKANPNVHKVSLHCPPRDAANGIESTAFFKLRHYLGTQEQFSFRSDPRKTAKNGPIPQGANYDQRNLDAYVRRGAGANYMDSDSQGWIEGFIQQVGLAKAKELLAGVGQVGVE